LAVQWLNEALCPENRDFVVADSSVFQNPLLRQAPKRYAQGYETGTSTIF